MEAKKEATITPKAEEQIKTAVRSLEDKCKAINFVIGRVYARRNGASTKLRDKIKIPAKLYNAFSHMHGIKEFTPEMKDILKQLVERLNYLYSKEKEVFDDDYKKFSNITHEPNGDSKIIDVLIKNDNDPVREYFLGALDACETVLGQMGEDAHAHHEKIAEGPVIDIQEREPEVKEHHEEHMHESHDSQREEKERTSDKPLHPDPDLDVHQEK